MLAVSAAIFSAAFLALALRCLTSSLFWASRLRQRQRHRREPYGRSKPCMLASVSAGNMRR